MNPRRLHGVLTALVTPFTPDLRVDMAAFEKLVLRQLEGGVHGLVPCGTTGETPALEDDEWAALIERTVALAGEKVPVVAGTGTNNTLHSIARTRRARDLGAYAALVVTPYYNKPNPAGLLAHFRAVAEQGGLPVVVYNVPGRTGLNMAPEQVLAAGEIPGVAGVKEASGSLGQAMTVLAGRKPELAVLSGEDELTAAMLLMGAEGVISVVSNVDPAGTVRLVEAAARGDVPATRSEHYRLQDLIRALFCETSPAPAKAALARLGLCTDMVRPPLAPASPATRVRLEAALQSAGLL